MIIRPQPGAQERFLSSPADIAIYGGAAGGGKSFGLLLEPLRHVDNPGFGAVAFRRTSPQITNEGGLWDEACKLYGQLSGSTSRMGPPPEYRFRSGVSISFCHLQHEDTKLDWQGSQVPLLLFDELTHFTKSQFWYLLSRNRSTCGVRPYVRATCNPDADSWVAELIAWWIDQETGLPIAERAGVLRWFIRLADTLLWGDSADELIGKYPDCQPKSLTFVPAKLTDNRILMEADPGYRANLLALPYVERERLLHGNWKVRPAAGLYFQSSWCPFIDALPAGLRYMRGWDLAATPKTETNDPDWTAGVLLGMSPDKRFYVCDARWLQGSPHQVQSLVQNTASEDGRIVEISVPQDPAAAGKAQALSFLQMLAGYNVTATPEARNPGGSDPTPSRQSAKVTRFSPFSAQAQAGNVSILRGPWNRRWIDELQAFPEATHDDTADATARAFNQLNAGGTGYVQRLGY